MVSFFRISSTPGPNDDAAATELILHGVRPGSTKLTGRVGLHLNFLESGIFNSVAS